MPGARKISAIDVLDNQSDIYLSIPKSADEELLKILLKNNAGSIKEKDLEQILERITKVYIGVNKSKTDSQFQLAIDGNIPKQFIPSVLNEKKGWTNTNYKTENKQTYKIYSNKEVNLAFPASNIACMGRNLEIMLDIYSEQLSKPVTDFRNEKQIKEKVYDYLSESQNEIRFYTDRTQNFIYLLTGLSLDLKIVDVYGSMEKTEESSENYNLKLFFTFSNEKYLKASKALLKLAFGISNTDLNVQEGNTLSVSNFKISKEQINKMISL